MFCTVGLNPVHSLRVTSASECVDESSVVIERVEIGFNGCFKVGDWSPIQITLQSAVDLTVRIVVETVDPDEHAVELPGPRVALTAGQARRVQAAFRSGRLSGEIAIRVENDAGRVLVTRRVESGDQNTIVQPALRQDVLLWVTLGHPPGFESVVSQDDLTQSKEVGKSSPPSESRPKESSAAQVQVVHLDSPAALPSRQQGEPYSSLDALVLAVGEKSSKHDDWLPQLTTDQNEALRNWVQSGGHLVLAVGARAKEYRDSLLAAWVPVPVLSSLSELRQLTGVETFSGRNQALSFPGVVKAAKLDGATLSDRHVLVQGADGPLLVRVPYGLGRVTFLGLDITRPPLANWKALDSVCRKMTSDLKSGTAAHREQRQGQLGRQGITDLATQLHAAQDQFTGVNRPSIWSVMGLIAVYIVLLGPVDYFVVQRLFGRSILTWVTFPLLVCLASAASLWAAARWNGATLQANQIDILDVVDMQSPDASQIVRGHSWLNLFSSETATYRISVKAVSLGKSPAEEKPTEVNVSWSGVPEDVVGGMYRLGGLNLARRRYGIDESVNQIEHVPIPIWSSKSFEAEWTETAKQLVNSSLESSGVGRLDGTISHALPVPLEDCLLTFGGRMYRLGSGQSPSTLAPYQEWSPAKQGQLRDLRNFLTNTVAQREERTDRQRSDVYVKETPYDPSHTNVDELVRMLTFHQAAGGSGYTGLNHDLLRSLDLSELMQLGRAVLIGRIKPPASKVLVNGNVVEPTERATYVRFVVPVKQLKGDDR